MGRAFSPLQVDDLGKDALKRRKEAEKKSRQAQVVSTAVISEMKDQDVAVGSVASVLPSSSSSANLAGDAAALAEEENVLAENQKLGLVCALLEIGEWESARDLMDRMPHFYALSCSERIAKALVRIVHWKVQAFYKRYV